MLPSFSSVSSRAADSATVEGSADCCCCWDENCGAMGAALGGTERARASISAIKSCSIPLCTSSKDVATPRVGFAGGGPRYDVAGVGDRAPISISRITSSSDARRSMRSLAAAGAGDDAVRIGGGGTAPYPPPMLMLPCRFTRTPDDISQRSCHLSFGPVVVESSRFAGHLESSGCKSKI